MPVAHGGGGEEGREVERAEEAGLGGEGVADWFEDVVGEEDEEEPEGGEK